MTYQIDVPSFVEQTVESFLKAAEQPVNSLHHYVTANPTEARTRLTNIVTLALRGVNEMDPDEAKSHMMDVEMMGASELISCIDIEDVFAKFKSGTTLTREDGDVVADLDAIAKRLDPKTYARMNAMVTEILGPNKELS
ncbi:MAG: hypothetical protein EBQ80_03545 [Proteobacteria bacterium]|nr:hypothetical protein [Bacteroidota bacterium]NBX86302.1 hypothetical protein [Pseudomonadota bacterium]